MLLESFQRGSRQRRKKGSMKNNSTEIDTMREEYDINALNPRKNPYAGRLKRPITINVNNKTIDYFKEMVSKTGIPYQN